MFNGIIWKRTFCSVQCDQLIEQYEPLLVQLLLQTLDPDFVCMVRRPSRALFNMRLGVVSDFVRVGGVQKLGACPEAVQRLLGLEQCSWGPAYWCKNVETASRCNVSVAVASEQC